MASLARGFWEKATAEPPRSEADGGKHPERGTAVMKFPDLAKRISSLGTVARKLFFRSAVTGMGALALGPALPATASAQSPPDSSAVVTLLNRERRSPFGKLVLQLVNSSGRSLLASHGSHSSHGSHGSHSSHASHYSSSQSPSVAPPTDSQPKPSPTPSAGVVPSTPLPMVSAESVVMSEEGAEQTLITLTQLNIKGSYIAGKHQAGILLFFFLRPDTKIQMLGPAKTTRQWREFTGLTPPLRLHQKILVAWKVDPASSRKVAIKLSLME